MVPQNIKINMTKSLDAKLVNDLYFDFMLYKGEAYGADMSDSCLVSDIDFSNPKCYTRNGAVKSLGEWDGATNPCGLKLKNIGMTGMDNGLISFDKDTIRNDEFIKLFFNSILTVDRCDKKFYLHAVDGNTKKYNYDIKIETKDGSPYLSCNGGFLQGFFKSPGHNYQVLPDTIDSDWHFEFVIRPRSDYKQTGNTLNNDHPENAGTFFYIGTRAENKFSEIYDKKYTPDYKGYLDKPFDYYRYDDPNYPIGGDVDFFMTQEREEKVKEECGYREQYLIGEREDKDVSMNDVSIDFETDNTETVSTNNKFLLFNRTCTGYTTQNWDRMWDNLSFNLKVEKREYKDNPFLLFNRTCTGYTTENIDEYFESTSDEYNLMQDVIGNAFSLQYNEDGSISYNYTMKDCNADGFTQMKETSKPGIIKDNEWNVVNIRFSIVNNSYDECIKEIDGQLVKTYIPKNVGKRKMKLMIYVNGKLVFISKELNEFNFRALNDDADKQEGVPYNISIGGGTQGLGERIWPDYKQEVKNHYYLENNYAGSFIGDIKSFKMFDCMQNYQTILKNFNNYNII